MRVLVIEDSVDIAEAVEAKLTRAGHHVVLAQDGISGEELAIHGEFDVVVLDINLPGRSGFDVMAHMRQQNSPTPVLVITARNQLDDKISLLDLGADDYIVKPFDLGELEARLRAVTRRHQGLAKSLIRVGGLEVDLSSRSARVDGRPLELGRREFEVLETLASHAGNTVSKERLYLKLFGHDDAGTPNAVELLVSRVRRKLDEVDVEIVTHRGVGYMLRSKSSAVV
ncbi:response regulator transcription factor [Rhizobium sp. NTR19]|uniref:Response regulator transcription factor n=1 Tax=Neorhizobium turbinariae TaxID=2937795 RepID=A0ABT0IPL3_9HYPH|nr:response regulator transcription factor [Neorhizobium turbinariae]MCK8779816.1 response regulator transcription factor [Neorhizobium turbinariae]